jgi:hypothetical protein
MHRDLDLGALTHFPDRHPATYGASRRSVLAPNMSSATHAFGEAAPFTPSLLEPLQPSTQSLQFREERDQALNSLTQNSRAVKNLTPITHLLP